MNPETGEFVKETQEAARASSIPEVWPRFALGAKYEIGWNKWRLDRVYHDSVRVRLAHVLNTRAMSAVIGRYSVGMIVNMGAVVMQVKAVCNDSLVLVPQRAIYEEAPAPMTEHDWAALRDRVGV